MTSGPRAPTVARNSAIWREPVMSRDLGLFFAVAAAVAATALPVPALAQQDDTEKQFGIVHFETSCNETAQRRFDRAMRYQHSFWYQSSKEIFEETLKADPECAIAYWGIALSLLWNPHVPTPAKNLAEGAAAIAKGKSIGARSQRERDYIDALAAMYADHDKVPHGARVQAYVKAMEALAPRYPNDDEAQIFYGITLNVAASPNDKTYANQLKGAAILEPIFKRQPRHPGVAHYLIHLYDTPALAEKGLEAARLYAKIAPGASHAQHMPSHILTRVGYWQESIDSNSVSRRVAKEAKEPHEQLHAMDYQVYAYLQLGQDKNAKAVIDEMMTVAGFTETYFVGPYALAASPARYVLERGDWKGAAELTVRASPVAGFTEPYCVGPYPRAASPARYLLERGDWKGAAELTVRPSPLANIQAITHFARALGAARSGNPEAAKADIGKLAELRDKLRAAKDAYWSEQVDIQWQVASAWALYAEGKNDEALKAMSAAADAEDRTEKHPVTPGVPTPARELYGTMLLERGMAREARAAVA